MTSEFSAGQLRRALLCGILGCLLMAGGDWLMLYGNTAYSGNLMWLTAGAAQISPARNSLAMALSFPAILLYAVALFAVRQLLTDPEARRRYAALTVAGLTPWLCLHLLYVLILFAFSWLQRAGYAALSYSLCEAMFGQFTWLVLVSEALMLPPFLYLLWQFAKGKSVYPRSMALNNPLLLFAALKLLTLVLPDTPFRLAFTNGLMSEAMLLWFLLFLLTVGKVEKAP